MHSSSVLLEQSHLPCRKKNFLLNAERCGGFFVCFFFFYFSVHRSMFLPREGLQLQSGGMEAEMTSLFFVFLISFPT